MEVSLKTNFEFFSKLGVWIKFGFTKKNHFHYIKKIKREDKMTSSKSKKKILEIEFGTKIYLLSFIAIYFISIAKSSFLKTCILGQIKVHQVIYKTIILCEFFRHFFRSVFFLGPFFSLRRMLVFPLPKPKCTHFFCLLSVRYMNLNRGLHSWRLHLFLPSSSFPRTP